MVRAAIAALLGAALGCSNPCDDLVEKRCACGPEACQSVRHELKFEMELLKSLGARGKKTLAERCQARLGSVSCP
jgi:hypothetical protein